MISAWQVGSQVWLVHTAKVAQPMHKESILPIGSVILDVEQATALKEQLVEAITDADSLIKARAAREARKRESA